MEIQNFKRWHWVAIGLLVGLVMSYAFSNHDLGEQGNWRDYEIKQRDFERYAFSRSRDTGEPMLQDMVIEPPVEDYNHQAVQIVRGQRLQMSVKTKQVYRVPFFFYADSPYLPLVHPPNVELPTGKTVMDFLTVAQHAMAMPADAKDKQPWQAATPMRFRFGWEYASRWNSLLWIGGSVLFIGGLWPTLLNALVDLGYSKPRTVDESKESFFAQLRKRKSTSPVLGKTAVSADEQNKLDELNRLLEGRLAPSGAHHAATAGATADDEIPTFGGGGSGEPADVTAAAERPEETEEERRARFRGGDFYPVARGKNDK